MKTILAYGDSLTYGTDPVVVGKRHAYEDRWPTRLEAGLGGKARVIAEGLGGRTTAFDDFSAVADRNGARILPTLLASHAPLDAVVIMLGSNDMKTYLNGSAHGAAMGMKRLAEIVRTHPWPQGAAVPQKGQTSSCFEGFHSACAPHAAQGRFSSAAIGVIDGVRSLFSQFGDGRSQLCRTNS